MKLLLFPLAAHHYSHRGEIWLLNLESSYRSPNSVNRVMHYLKHGRKTAKRLNCQTNKKPYFPHGAVARVPSSLGLVLVDAPSVLYHT